MNLNALFNIMAVASFFSIAGWNWDGWWHVALGRDTFFSPPHILQVTTIIFLMGCAFAYHRTGETAYRRAFFFLVATLSAGFLDVFWHIYFGVERLVSPLIIWSPPHLIAFITSLAGFFIVLRHWMREYKRNGEPIQFFRIILLAAAVAGVLHIVIFPLEPLGWHNVLGFWGVGVTMFFSVLYMLWLIYQLPKTGAGTLVMLTVIMFFGFEPRVSASVALLPPHADPPLWLHFFSAVPGVMVLDFLTIKKYHPMILGGLVAGFAYGMYFIFWRFVETSAFPNSQADAVVLVVASIIGGIIAGGALQFFFNRAARAVQS